MTDSTPLTTANLDARVGRRQALRIGGLSVSLAALVAACGTDRGGDTAPGRVGNADPILPPPDYAVNDVVLLRTASSLELTAVAVYETAKGLGVLEGSTAELVERLQANHQATADKMAELTEAAGGTAWTDTNPWIMERAVAPIVDTITMSDDVLRDVINLAITLENLAASTHQSLTGILTEPKQRLATANASTEESRHSAALVLNVFGTGNRFSPALVNEDVERTPQNTLAMYAINSAFGSLAQQELIVGEADENGARTTFILATPAANSFIYEELS
ncbi:hypothetical protein [Ilumatobacter sp.]|uniref:hypothetical protein n=1 Tax=Ilumatobacter sp. TaxID=1967498 RepID=UPI0037526B6E